MTRRASATYRLQLHSGFRLRDARRLVPYLDSLGVTDLYLSPLLRARSTSSHFDVDWESWGTGRLRYRRFFDIDGLVGVRVEDPEVFRATHARVLEWVRRGWATGLRIDHVDRTYIRGGRVSARDRAFIESALRTSRASRRALGLLRRALLSPRGPGGLRFVLRWQQLTGPVVAKGLEDTASYRYLRLASLNDVGSEMDPEAPGDVDVFHRRGRERAARWPGTMGATSTHDTKRSEDVRARLHVLSEVPGEWGRRVERWRRWNRDRAGRAGGRRVPDPNEEYLLYQTLVGAWPLRPEEVPAFQERLRGYLVKAAREAKVHTSWRRPDEPRERALTGFADRILEPDPSNRFLTDFRAFQERVAWFGALNSLSQVVLKCGSPGTPDLYQGSELWDFSLVDPDNRRPVDFRRRAALLRELEGRLRGDRGPLLRDLWANWRDGRIKLLATRAALGLRRSRPALFARGLYLPLRVDGARAGHVVAFARVRGREWAVAAAGRWFTRLGEPGTPPAGRTWGGTALLLPRGAPRRWRDALAGTEVEAEGRRLRAAEVFAGVPATLLEGR